MNHNQIEKLKRLTQNIRDAGRRNPAVLAAVDTLEVELSEVAAEDFGERVSRLRMLGDMRESLDRLARSSMCKRQAE